jgi:hypothetical protein
MTSIKLVVSDVDGTLVTTDKRLTDAARTAVEKLRAAGIGFTIVSSRPTVGMDFLIKPLALTLPFGSFNGSSIVDPNCGRSSSTSFRRNRRAIELLEQFGSISGCYQRTMLTRSPTANIGRERAISAILISSTALHLSGPCVQDRDLAPTPACQSAAKRRCVRPSARRPPPSVPRRYLDIRRPAMTGRSSLISPRVSAFLDAVATIGDMETCDVRPQRRVVRDGNAADEIKRPATHVAASNSRTGSSGSDLAGCAASSRVEPGPKRGAVVEHAVAPASQNQILGYGSGSRLDALVRATNHFDRCTAFSVRASHGWCGVDQGDMGSACGKLPVCRCATCLFLAKGRDRWR